MLPPNLLSGANRRAKNRQYQQQNRSPANSRSSNPTSSNNARSHQQLATNLPTQSRRPEAQNCMSNSEHPGGPGPIPASFDELDHERSYLLDCLQHENFKATQLLRRITPLEEDLIIDNVSSIGNRVSTKRNMRNQIGWFKSRLEETARQERRILVRLGQLTFQIQKRVRSTQVEDEYREFDTLRRSALLNYNKNMTPMQQMQPSFAPCYPTQFTPTQTLSTVPEWQQQHGDYSWQQNTHEVPPGNPHSKEISPMDTPRSDSVDTGTPKDRRPSYFRRTVSMGDADLDSSCSKHGHICKHMVKRLSLPIIPGLSQIWSLTKEERETAKGEE
ncbi:uncharacterized protein PAC_13335 [Phialocephala subalpina]|uniref:Uncharacterized protein n=1 Tax=Phialocephala subalpina TaxID=576137 RepID=A0A1L7XEJ9_9HELO|nr:uncharacterized protein PAC_13335 [Phialocephala subalpina]